MLTMFAGVAYAGVATTKHNLSISGPGALKAATETRICIFCHTPHNAQPSVPLWNRRASGSNYTPYSSSTAIATPGQPTGASILCLSCHDGTIALGDVLSRDTPIPFAGGVTTIPVGPGRLGTDLSDDHPISFAYTASLANQSGELIAPSTLTGLVRLDASGQLQCTTCHDAHNDPFGKFLVMPNSASALCKTCHQKQFWTESSHAVSNATWNGVGTDPWPTTDGTTVADNACENCHQPHSADGRERLLHHASEEDNCAACHNGNVASANVMAEFDKASSHPITETTGVHDPQEPAIVSQRHAECADCHNPHAAKTSGAGISGALTGVRGVNITGAEVDPASQEYEVCFRCHADSTNKPAPRTSRQIVQTNVRLEFNTSNPSFHPVAGTGKNSNVPSLIAPLTTASTISCSDCHNNDSGPQSGGAGPGGPHGSTFAPILERQYVTLDNTAEQAAAYALCYKCHDRSSVLGDQSFPHHRKHVSDERAPCNICHDPHGISLTQGTPVNNTHLINFDISVVTPSSSNRLQFEDRGTFSGRCYVNCHGVDHDGWTY